MDILKLENGSIYTCRAAVLNSGDPYLNGLAQDFRINNDALTASQITQVMNEYKFPVAE
jgi:hypothetical protein